MRRLTKSVKPPFLKSRELELASAYMNAVNGGGSPGRPWAHPEIKEALRAETLSKCAYCESYIEHISFAHVEHILPRKYRPELVVEWTNLTLACERCNKYKGDYYEPSAPLLNPYGDEPTDHLLLMDGLVLPKPGSQLGRRTVLRLRLSRPELIQMRAERLERLGPLLDAWEKEIGPDKELLARQLRREADPAAEFSSVVAAALPLLGL